MHMHTHQKKIEKQTSGESKEYIDPVVEKKFRNTIFFKSVHYCRQRVVVLTPSRRLPFSRNLSFKMDSGVNVAPSVFRSVGFGAAYCRGAIINGLLFSASTCGM